MKETTYSVNTKLDVIAPSIHEAVQRAKDFCDDTLADNENINIIGMKVNIPVSIMWSETHGAD